MQVQLGAGSTHGRFYSATSVPASPCSRRVACAPPATQLVGSQRHCTVHAAAVPVIAEGNNSSVQTPSAAEQQLGSSLQTPAHSLLSPSDQQEALEHEQDIGHNAASLPQHSPWADVAQLLSQHEQLTYPQLAAALGQLCLSIRTVSPQRLQHNQQYNNLLAQLADAALQQLPELNHQQIGELLALFQALGHKPPAAWVKSVLQRAATELVHYTPAELALLLLTATQAVTRHNRRAALPTLQFTRSSPTAGPVVQIVPAETPAQAAVGAASPQDAGGSDSTGQQGAAVRRANTVLTSAWLQHFMTTFERYLACRTAHPQLRPEYLETVITCFAALKVQPDKFWLYLFVRQMSAHLPACQPAGVVRILAALTAMGYQLPEHVVSHLERQVTGPSMASLGPLNCLEVIKTVAAQKQKPSEVWMQQLLAFVLKGSSQFAAGDVVTLLSCVGTLSISVKKSWMELLLLQLRGTMKLLSAAEHVVLIQALSQQQYRPGAAFMVQFMTQVQTQLPQLSIQQQAALVAGLAAVGYKPAPAWMAAFFEQFLGQQITADDAGQLLKLMVALRQMQYVPTGYVAGQLAGIVDAIAPNMLYPQLQPLKAALADLQYKPTTAAAAVTTYSSTVSSTPSATAAAADTARGAPAQTDSAAQVDSHGVTAPLSESGVDPTVVNAADSKQQQQQEGQDPATLSNPQSAQTQQQQQEDSQQGEQVGRKSVSVVTESLELFT